MSSEAHIVAQAGRLGAVTIATNMAGRGTDIQLGGNLEFRINDELKDMAEGAERDAAHRADQRGDRRRDARRCWMPAVCSCSAPSAMKAAASTTSCAAVRAARAIPACRASTSSLDDDLLRIFGPDTLFARMMRSSLEDGEALPPSKWMSKAIETAQKKVEVRNYDIRKQVVEYDDVMNDQRKVIYEQRADIMDCRDGQRRRHATCATRRSTRRRRALPAGHLSRAVGHRRAQGGCRAACSAWTPDIDAWLQEHSVEPEMLVERLHRTVGRASGREGRADQSGELAADREEHPPPESRSSLEGASLHARCAAPGRAPACLCAEDSRSTNISMRPLRCSSACWARSARM